MISARFRPDCSSIAQAAAIAAALYFWVNQKTGKLQVDNVKIHKVPLQEDGIWTEVPRYTFDSETFDITN